MIPEEERLKVMEVTLDMAESMNKIVKYGFPKASMVIDRFHVQKLAYDAVQEIRIKHRWEAIEEENSSKNVAKAQKVKHEPVVLENGETKRQLLARSRYLLFKHKSKWTHSQQERALLLFKYYPDIEQAYNLSTELGAIYNSSKSKGVAYTKLARWYDKIDKVGIKSFNAIANTIYHHYITILNYFNNKSTNASAESFNAKIKAFRHAFRGVRDPSFFLYRLSMVYA